MVIYAMSDQYNYYKALHGSSWNFKNIDLLIYAGGFSYAKDLETNKKHTIEVLKRLEKFKARHKVFIGGPHDLALEKEVIDLSQFPSLTYLKNESIMIEGIKIYGSPYHATFLGKCFKWNFNRLFDLWENIPMDTDIVITSVPPRTILDVTYSLESSKNVNVGDKFLLFKIFKVKPHFHFFGAVHDEVCNGTINGYKIYNSGIRRISKSQTKFVNCSSLLWGGTSSKYRFKFINKGYRVILNERRAKANIAKIRAGYSRPSDLHDEV